MALFELIQTSPGFLTFLCVVVGLLVGSFLNVVVHRLPKMMEREWAAQCAELRGETPEPPVRYNLVVPRSACPKCGHMITALENVPVLSWLALRASAGRARPPFQHAIPSWRR